MSSVTAVCPVHGAFPSQTIRRTDRSGAVSVSAGNCPTCGRKTAAIDEGYDFSNFAVAKALTSPARTVKAFDDLRHHLDDVCAAARERWDPAVVSGKLDALTQHEPDLALALRSRLAGHTQEEVIELVSAIGEAVTAMRTATANGRLSDRLKDAIVHAALP